MAEQQKNSQDAGVPMADGKVLRPQPGGLFKLVDEANDKGPIRLEGKDAGGRKVEIADLDLDIARLASGAGKGGDSVAGLQLEPAPEDPTAAAPPKNDPHLMSIGGLAHLDLRTKEPPTAEEIAAAQEAAEAAKPHNQARRRFYDIFKIDEKLGPGAEDPKVHYLRETLKAGAQFQIQVPVPQETAAAGTDRKAVEAAKLEADKQALEPVIAKLKEAGFDPKEDLSVRHVEHRWIVPVAAMRAFLQEEFKIKTHEKADAILSNEVKLTAAIRTFITRDDAGGKPTFFKRPGFEDTNVTTIRDANTKQPTHFILKNFDDTQSRTALFPDAVKESVKITGYGDPVILISAKRVYKAFGISEPKQQREAPQVGAAQQPSVPAPAALADATTPPAGAKPRGGWLSSLLRGGNGGKGGGRVAGA